MCATIRSLPFTTGAKPIFLSGFNCRARAGSHRKNLIFAPCAAYHGVFLQHIMGFFMLAYSAVFVLYCKKQQDCLIQFCCCNLSPRGDGNNGMQPAPDMAVVATYPREGTETNYCRPQSGWKDKLQLIPARGRKQYIIFTFKFKKPLQLIPARGRKPL